VVNDEFSPEHGGKVEEFSGEHDDHGDEEEDEKDYNFPRITRGHRTHSRYRRTDYVTRICAHVTNTAAVAVSLNSQNVKLFLSVISHGNCTFD